MKRGGTKESALEERRKSRKRGSDLTKIRGVVVPIAWDESGQVVAIAISTWQEDEYVVDFEGKGKELLSHICDEVEVIGRTRAEDNRKIIVVRELSLKRGSAEMAPPLQGDPGILES
jgi:hypothetical protein